MIHFGLNGYNANYNSDMSGGVILSDPSGNELTIPGKFLLEFVASYVAGRKIATIERASCAGILGIPEQSI
jgi:hypothetical protein